MAVPTPRAAPRDKFLSSVPPELRIFGVKVDTEDELGRGSDAVVYAGRWEGVSVAVKVLHQVLVEPGSVGREALLERFLGECKRLHSLRHPNIVRFLGVCTHAGRPALVTERLDSTVQKRYASSSDFTYLDELRILTDTASALAFIHAKKLLHRDLTARNVLVTAANRAMLTDVGAARVMPESKKEALADASKWTQAPGTLAYMSPETLSSEETLSYDQQMDAFSFGVLMMEVIAKREPSAESIISERFEGPSDDKRPIPEVTRRRKDLAAVGERHPLYGLIVKCLDNAPEKRPTSAELRDTLLKLLSEAEAEQTKKVHAGRSTSVTRSTSAPSVHNSKPASDSSNDIDMKRTIEAAVKERTEAIERKYMAALKEKEQELKKVQSSKPASDSSNDIDMKRTIEAAVKERTEALERKYMAALKEKEQELKKRDEQLCVIQKQRDNFAAEAQRSERLLSDAAERQPRQLESSAVQEVGSECDQQQDLATRCARFAAVLNTHDITAKQLLSFTTPPPFAAKWRLTRCPIEQPTSAAPLLDYATCLHRSFVYVVSRVKSGICRLFKTADFESWTEMKLTSNVSSCVNLLSHNGCLYCLSVMPSNDMFSELWRLEEEKEQTAAWRQVASHCCPQEGFFTTLCSAGECILLLGCVKRDFKSYGTVLAYNTRTGEWLTEDAWPPLLHSVVDSQAILYDGKVNVFGGTVRKIAGGYSSNCKVLSLPIDCALSSSSSSSQWLDNCFPQTSASMCGVACAYGHLFIAGGHNPTTYRECAEVFVLNAVDGKSWIPLPSLQVKRSSVQLLGTREHVAAIGGLVGTFPRNSRTPVIEVLDIQL